MDERFNRAISCMILATHCAAISPSANYSELRSKSFEEYSKFLGSAQIERYEENWKRISEYGLDSVLSDWEQKSLNLKESEYDKWFWEYENLKGELQGEMQTAFNEWYFTMREEEAGECKKSHLYEELMKAKKNFQFNDNGVSTRIVSPEKIKEAKEQWLTICDEIAENCGGIRNSSIESEITNKLMNELLYDHDSLRNLSDKDAAEIIVRNLSSEAEQESEKGMVAVLSELNLSMDSVSEGHNADEKKMLENLEKELEKGLSKWDEVERSFLASRVEWEQNAKNVYVKNSEIWSNAYNTLMENKNLWVERTNERIEEMKRKFLERNELLNEEMKEYFEELENKLLVDTERQNRLLDMYEATYEQCREILNTAENGIQSWFARWAGKFNGVYSYWKTEDTDKVLGKILYVDSENVDVVRNQITVWKNEYIGIVGNALDSRSSELYSRESYYEYEIRDLKNELRELNSGIMVGVNWIEAEKIREERSKEINEKLSRSEGFLTSCKNERNRIKGFLSELSRFTSETSNEDFLDLILKINKGTSISSEYRKFFDTENMLWGREDELEYWLNVIEDYSEKADTSLKNIYGLTAGNSGNEYSDELKNEYLKISALEDYWEARVFIAEYVKNYIDNRLSSVEVLSDTENKLSEAYSDYEQKKIDYDDEIQRACEVRTEIILAEEKYVSKLKEADSKLMEIKELKKEYDLLFDEVMSLSNSAFISRANELCKQINNAIYSSEEICENLYGYYSSISEINNIVFNLNQKTIKDQIVNGLHSEELYVPSVEELDEMKVFIENVQAEENILTVKNLMDKGEFKKLNEIDSYYYDLILSLVNDAEEKTEDIGYINDIFMNLLEALKISLKNKVSEKNYALEVIECTGNGISLCEEDVSVSEKFIWYKAFEKSLEDYLRVYVFHEEEIENLYEKIKDISFETEEEFVNEVNDLYASESENKYFKALMNRSSLEGNYIVENASFYYTQKMHENGYDDDLLKKTVTEEYGKYSVYYANLFTEKASSEVNKILKSAIYLNKENGEIVNLTKEMNENELLDFYRKLDEASSDIGETGLTVVSLLKNQIDESRKSSDVEELNKKLTGAIDSVVYASDAEYHIYEYALCFDGWKEILCFKKINDDEIDELLSSSAVQMNYFGSRIAEEYSTRRKLVEDLSDLYEELLVSTEKTRALNKEMEDLQVQMETKQNEYDRINDKASGGEDSFLSEYEKACKRYTNLIDLSEKKYEELENARRIYRACEELYLWAQNEYLHEKNYSYGTDYITPDEKYRTSSENLEYVKLQKNVLEKLMEEQKSIGIYSVYDSLGNDLIQNYETSMKQYFISRIMSFEYEEQVALQKEELFKCENVEQDALNRLVKNASSGESFSIPYMVLDYISVNVDENGNYDFSLALDSPETGKTELLEKYYKDLSVLQTDVYGNEYYSTQAKLDARDFIEELNAKSYSMEDLSLAVLYLKYSGNIEQQKRWYRADENPEIYENYRMGDLPSSTHDVNIREIYNDGRITVIRKAYEKIMNNNGERDLARYILYSETNINSMLELYEREKDELAARAIEKVKDALQNKYDYYNGLGIGFSAVAAAFAATAALPWHAWALVPMAAALASAATMFHAASKIAEVKKDAVDVQNGYSAIVNEYSSIEKSYYNQYVEARKKRIDAEHRLNLIVYGMEEWDGSYVDYDKFIASMKEVFDSGKTSINFSYISNLQPEEKNEGALKDVYLNLCRKDNEKIGDSISDIKEALTAKLCENSLLLFTEAEKRRTEQKELTEKYNEALMDTLYGTESKNDFNEILEKCFGKNSWNEKAFCNRINSFFYEDILKDVPFLMTRTTEEYIDEIFENVNEIFKRGLYSENNGIISEKKFEKEILKKDLLLQEHMWENQISNSVIAGNYEWQKAEEEMNTSFYRYKKNWEKEVDHKLNEWNVKYNEFIGDKQSWINSVYLDSVCNALDIDGKYKLEDEITRFTDISGDCFSGNSFMKPDVIENLNNFFENLNPFTEDFLFTLKDNETLCGSGELLRLLDRVNLEQCQLEEEMKGLASRYAFNLFHENLTSLCNDYQKKLEERNKSTESWENNLVRKSGYKTGNTIYRDAVVDSTVWETVRKRQTVHKYEYFRKDIPYVETERLSFPGNTSDYLDSLMIENQRIINNWYESVFGIYDEKGNSLYDGELSEHLGYAPSFIDDIDVKKGREANISKKGKGEIGLIMLDYLWNSIENSNGYTELNKAMYDQKLFSCDLGGIEIPTIRTVSSIVCDIASSATGNEWLRYFDDAVYTSLDYSMNYKTDSEVLNTVFHTAGNFGISKLTSAGSDLLYSKISKNISKLRHGTQLIQGLKKGTSAFFNSVLSSYLDGFDVTTGTMDWSKGNSLWNKASSYSDLISSGITGILGEADYFDPSGNVLNPAMFGSIASRNQLIGNLVTESIEYAGGESFDLNLVNIKGVGVLNLGLTDGKLKASISENGVDVSLSSIMELAESFCIEGRINEIKKENPELLSLLNLLSYTGIETNNELAHELLFSDSRMELNTVFNIEKAVDEVINDTGLNQEEKFKALVMYGAKLAEQYAMSKDKSMNNNEFTQLCSAGAVLLMGNKFFNQDFSDNEELEEEIQAAVSLDIAEGNIEIALAVYNERIRKSAEVRDSGDYQNNGKYNEDILGFGYTHEEKVKILNDMFLEEFTEKEMEKYIYDNLLEEKLVFRKMYEKEFSNLSLEEKLLAIGVEQKEIDEIRKTAGQRILEKYNSKEYSLGGYGCALATACYIAYSINGEYHSLKDVNQIAMEINAYNSNGDAVIPEENLLGIYGKDNEKTSYQRLINAIVGQDVIQYETSRSTSEGIYKKLVSVTDDQDKLYYIHMRTYYREGKSINGHSVLFESMKDTGNYNTSTVNILNPWRLKDDSYKTRKLTDISRADFYYLTDIGKEVYSKSRI